MPLRRAEAAAPSMQPPRRSWLPRWTGWFQCHRGTAWLRLLQLRLHATNGRPSLAREDNVRAHAEFQRRGDHGRNMAKLRSKPAWQGGFLRHQERRTRDGGEANERDGQALQTGGGEHGTSPWLLGGLCTRPVSGRLREVFNIRCALTHTGTHKRGFSASF